MAWEAGLISVVVPYRNARGNLGECVDSLLSQDYPPDRYEVILVDDASADGGESVLGGYDGRVVKVMGSGKGSYDARNRGIAAAKGGILAFTDSDCVVDRGWLRSISEAFDSEGVVSAGGEIRAHNPTTSMEVFYEGVMSQKGALSQSFPYAITANFAVRRRTLEEVGLFDGGLRSGGDVDLSWRLQAAGYGITYLPDALVYHKNMKTGWRLFRRILFQSSYAPYVVGKNLKFLERRGRLPRVGVGHYRRIASNVGFILLGAPAADRHKVALETILLIARKIGLFWGSLRSGFMYI
jgi:cellulose synthase/poly-beta-1,6-N-acetylglucosamine synthase-like glycosyltransferase